MTWISRIYVDKIYPVMMVITSAQIAAITIRVLSPVSRLAHTAD
jgi:hypothetical protein